MGDKRIYLPLLKVSLLLTLVLPGLSAAGEEAPHSALPGLETTAEMPAAPVIVDGVTLFRIRGIEGFPAERRAREIAARVEELAADPLISRDSLRIAEMPGYSLIVADKKPVLSLLDVDARLHGIERPALAAAYQIRVGEAIEAWRHDRDPAVLKRRALHALGATLLFLLALWAGQRVYRRLRTILETRLRSKIRAIKFKTFEILRGEQLWSVLMGLLRLGWAGIILIGTYFYLHDVLSLFPWTRGFANSLFAMLIEPLRTVGMGLIAAVPNLIFLLVLFFITRYALKLVRLFFDRVADGTVTLTGFETEWAWPTYRLVRILLIAFGLIVAYPYIPGSDSDAFKGVSIFIGVLFSLGSSSLIGNLVAGYSMVYRRAFKEGDRIKVGEQIGDVEHRRLLCTHLRSPKNEEVVIPNSVILNSEIINYSTLARQQGVILYTTVGIGYETPWRQVEAMLLEAAARTPGLLREPHPFVHQKALGDFSVTYEINAYCSEPQAMNRLYSELHSNILDLFNEYGVQIMTPAYEGDPEQPKVVPKEQWYAAPSRPPGGEQR